MWVSCFGMVTVLMLMLSVFVPCVAPGYKFLNALPAVIVIEIEGIYHCPVGYQKLRLYLVVEVNQLLTNHKKLPDVFVPRKDFQKAAV
jgi:hypothetical protein